MRTIRLDLASLSLDDLSQLRHMLRIRPGQRSLETQNRDRDAA
jgi:hypothetical protein